MKDSRNRTTNKSGKKLFEVVESLKEMDGARVTDLAKKLDLPESTVCRYLATLEEKGYIIKEDNRYYVGLKFLELGDYARNRRESFRLARPKVKQLAEKTNERSQFIIEEHGYAVYVYTETGDNAVLADSGPGKRIPMHATAAGKAMLAYFPKEKIHKTLDERGMESLTTNTITDRSELLEELDVIRAKGFSTNNQENIDGLRAVGVPVKSPEEKVVGALTVAGPTNRLKNEQFESKIPELLLGTANELELKFEYELSSL